MKLNYINMFSSYATFNKYFGSKSYQLSQEEFANLEYNVNVFLKDDRITDYNTSLDEIIDDFNISDNIIDCLIKLQKHSYSPSQKQKLTSLINRMKKALYYKAEAIKNKEETEEDSPEEQSSSIEKTASINNFATVENNVKNEEIERKYKNYSLYAVNNLLNEKESSFKTKRITTNTKQFDNLARDQLVEMFNAKNFYQLSQNEVHSLMQAVVNDYLKEQGVESCSVDLDILPFNDKCITHGEYDPNKGAISMNKNVLAMLKTAKDNNDQYYPYQILSTLIHEAHHRVQFSNVGKSNLSYKDQIVVNALSNPQNGAYADYLSCPDELDARNASLKYFRDCVKTAGHPEALSQFYNEKKKQEKAQPKTAVSPKVEAQFIDIYNDEYMQTNEQKFIDRRSFSNLYYEYTNGKQSSV